MKRPRTCSTSALTVAFICGISASVSAKLRIGNDLQITMSDTVNNASIAIKNAVQIFAMTKRDFINCTSNQYGLFACHVVLFDFTTFFEFTLFFTTVILFVR